MTDRQPRSPRFWWVLGGVLVTVAVAVTIWFAISATKDQIVWKDIGFERVDDRNLVMDFSVTREPGTPVRCTVKALDSTYGTVGTVDVEVPAADHRTTRLKAHVRTTTQAVTATVQECVRVP